MKNNKENRIYALCCGIPKRVYVYLADAETQQQFINDAEREGYCFSDGVKLSDREPDMFYAVNPDRTVNYINSIGRIAWQCKSEHILHLDYKKFLSE